MIERNFLGIALLLSVIALIHPAAFQWGKEYIPYFLGVIMFGMGLTLKSSDFVNVWQNRRTVLLGVLAQYTIMPILALVLSLIFQLPKAVVIGMVLVGACPGGTASNVITYLGKGNVALSVTMTLVSTILAPLLTPAIVYIAVRTMIDIHFWPMVYSVLWIVVFPLLGGLLLRRRLHSRAESLLVVFPSISMLTIAFVIAVIIGLNQGTILEFPFFILAAVIFHNLLGLIIGYGIGKCFNCDTRDCRTLAIEVGMQNSGLGASLATSFFTAQSALPSALFSLWHNISGISIARYWVRRTQRKKV